MKNHPIIQTVVPLVAGLLFLMVYSCEGQQKPENVKEQITTVAEPSVASSDKNGQIDHDPYFVESEAITSTHGPRSITRNIIQDRKGNFWMASWEGIFGYDNKTFTNYTNKYGLRRYHTFAVFEDSKGIIWFGTIGAGVYRYDPAVEGAAAFTNFTKIEGLASDRIGCFMEDTRGTLWVGTDGGLSYFDGKAFHSFTEKDGLCNNDINSIIEREDGKLLLGARGEACVFDPVAKANDSKRFSKFTRDLGKPFINVRCIIEDRQGHIWLGGNDGLWRYNGFVFDNFTTDFVGYIYEDAKSNIWYGSPPTGQSGWKLYRLDEYTLSSGQKTATIVREEQGQIFGIMEDAKGNIWYGQEQGVCRFDGKGFYCFGEEE